MDTFNDVLGAAQGLSSIDELIEQLDESRAD